MSQGYQHPETAPGALRLHLNENTAGCSPKVVAAVRALGPADRAWWLEVFYAGGTTTRDFSSADIVVDLAGAGLRERIGDAAPVGRFDSVAKRKTPYQQCVTGARMRLG